MTATDYLYDERPRQQHTGSAVREADVVQDASLHSIIKRAIECVEAETNALRTLANFDAKQLNSRKSRLLYELGKASRNLDIASLDRACLDDFQALRSALAENETALRSHISAVSEVAGILQKAIEREEADGTYTASGFASAGAI